MKRKNTRRIASIGSALLLATFLIGPSPDVGAAPASTNPATNNVIIKFQHAQLTGHGGMFQAEFEIIGWTRTGGIVSFQIVGESGATADTPGNFNILTGGTIPPNGPFLLEGWLDNALHQGHIKLKANFTPNPGGGNFASDQEWLNVRGWRDIVSARVFSAGSPRVRPSATKIYKYLIQEPRGYINLESKYTVLDLDEFALKFEVVSTMNCDAPTFLDSPAVGANQLLSIEKSTAAAYVESKSQHAFRIMVSVLIEGADMGIKQYSKPRWFFTDPV